MGIGQVVRSQNDINFSEIACMLKFLIGKSVLPQVLMYVVSLEARSVGSLF